MIIFHDATLPQLIPSDNIKKCRYVINVQYYDCEQYGMLSSYMIIFDVPIKQMSALVIKNTRNRSKHLLIEN